MSLFQQFLGGNIKPQLPAGNDPYASNLGGANATKTIASGLNDGSYLSMNGASIVLFNSSGTAVWTKTAANVNAAATGIATAVYVDLVDNAVYVMGLNGTTTTVYPAKIGLSSGTLTAIGAGATMKSGNTDTTGFITRAAQGSGDLTMYSADPNSGITLRKASVNSSTGAITSALAGVTSNGIQVWGNGSTGSPVDYVSADGSILFIRSSTPGTSGCLARNGKTAFVTISEVSASSFLASIVGSNLYFGNSAGIGAMRRTDFDTYLASLCTYYGI